MSKRLKTPQNYAEGYLQFVLAKKENIEKHGTPEQIEAHKRILASAIENAQKSRS